MPNTPYRPGSPCSGWWEQRWFGRRPMEHLWVGVRPPYIEGAGTDCIGDFLLEGTIATDGGVSLQKTYLGQHKVAYDGHYDGEGRMWGTWKCGPDAGRWMIAMRPGNDGTELPADVVEIRPGRRGGDTAS